MRTYDEACSEILAIYHAWKQSRNPEDGTDLHDGFCDLFQEEPYNCVECLREVVAALGVRCRRCKATDPMECWGAMHAALKHVLRKRRGLLDAEDPPYA